MLKKIAVAMVAAGGLMIAAAPAHAAHVSLSLGLPLPLPGVYAAPAPTYYGPPAAYAPAYAPPVVYETPYPVYYGPSYYGYYGPRVVYRGGSYWRGGYRGGYHGGWHR